MGPRLLCAFLVALPLGFSACAQSPPCTTYIHGTFQEGGDDKQSVISGKPSGIRTLRRGHTQKEHHKATGLKMVYQVNWVDDCTFQLTKRKVKAGRPERPWAEGDTITIHITDTWFEGYRYEATSNFSEERNTGAIKMIVPQGYGISIGL
jgi:hypothetical protein